MGYSHLYSVNDWRPKPETAHEDARIPYFFRAFGGHTSGQPCPYAGRYPVFGRGVGRGAALPI